MAKVQAAIKPSARIMVRLRSHRSIYTPAKGPINVCGNSAAMAAKASTSAEPVSMLSQIMIAKLTAELLSSEINWPVHIIKKVLFQEFFMLNLRKPTLRSRSGNNQKSGRESGFPPATSKHGRSQGFGFVSLV